MTPPRFSLPWSNPDLDVHPNPSEGWHRVAVIGLWTDPKILRRDWPDAAVVGPLRTIRGIDLLVRSLLANPQIRVVVVVGRDLSPGESVRKALMLTWGANEDMRAVPGSDLDYEQVVDVLQNVHLLGLRDDDPGATLAASLQMGGRYAQLALGTAEVNGWATDRSGGAIILPPPPPPENPELPAGLPGQRITGQTLADVWPRVLQEVLRFGNSVPTNYGDSRELLNLVSVIEDPKGSLLQPSLLAAGLTVDDLTDYYSRSFMGTVVPDGVAYTYGSRLKCNPNQVAITRSLLRTSPDTRAAWLTPWRPEEDCGKEEGRPCFVGAWFRAVGNSLNLTVTFRSQCLFMAFPLNLAAACRWLVEEADLLGMEVGVVTCVSMSAHIYDRDLEDASKVVSEHVKPGAWSQDPRSAWRVWLAGKKIIDDDGLPVEINHAYHAEVTDPGGTRVLRLFEAPTKERLTRDIQASGLVTSVQHALWLGAEIGRL